MAARGRLLAAGAALAVFTSAGRAGVIVYVDDDAPPGGDGSSWAQAYRFLQDGLSFATDPENGVTEVRVGGGVYLPDRSASDPDGSGNPSAEFLLPAGVPLVGGYAGYGAPDPDANDPDLYETVLSGDLDGNDGPGFTGNEENSYHVVVSNSLVLENRLERVTVAAGRAYGTGSNTYAGGLLSMGATTTVVDCKFERNWARIRGGAVYVEGGAMRLERCEFRGNYGDIGGCIQSRGPAEVVVIDSMFLGNESVAGSAIISFEGSLVVVGTKFVGNDALDSGGGVFTGADTTLINCVFSQNTCNFLGSAVEDVYGVTAINCVFSRNPGAVRGAIYTSGGGATTFDSCTFANNDSAAVMYSQSLPGPQTFRNCIFWGNTQGQLVPDGSAAQPTLLHCDVQGGWSGPGSGNIDADPRFVQPGTDDVRLSLGSPCIDAGDASLLPPDTFDLDGDGDTGEPIPYDLIGNPRVAGAEVDMGAYEGTFEVAPPAASYDDLDHFEVALLVPQTVAFDILYTPASLVFNLAGPDDASVLVTERHDPVHPGAGGYAEQGAVLLLTTSLADGEHRTRLLIPFGWQNLAGAAPLTFDLTAYDAALGEWVPAVALNTVASPGHGGPVGDRSAVQTTGDDWQMTGDVGDYGVVWNPALERGFVWANVDYAGDFGLGAPLCLADCGPAADSNVGVQDLLALLAAWGQPGPCDLTGDSVVGQLDLQTLIAAWGPCGVPAQARPTPPGSGALPAGDIGFGVTADANGDGRVNADDLELLRRGSLSGAQLLEVFRSWR